MASGRLVDYMGHGNIADRPASLTLTTDAIGWWYADDTSELSLWDGTVWHENIAAGGPVPDLDDLGDVDLTGFSDGDVLTFDVGSGNWIAAAPTGGGALDDLTDVDTTGVADGDTLIYDLGTTTWLVGAGGGGGFTYSYQDPPFADVVALLHFESALTDSTGFNTWTASGTAAVTSAQAMVGSQSLLVPGSGNSGIRAPMTDSRWDFGSGDFSIEWGSYYNGAPETFARHMQSGNGDIGGVGVSITTDSSSNLAITIGGVAGWVPFAIPQTGWHRIIICRYGSFLYAALDDQQPVIHSITGSVSYNSGYEWIIGGQSAGTSRSTNTYYDEVRITKGFSVLQPLSAFDMPTSAFPDS